MRQNYWQWWSTLRPWIRIDLWLVGIGAMLATSRVERHFVARYGDETESGDAQLANGG